MKKNLIANISFVSIKWAVSQKCIEQLSTCVYFADLTIIYTYLLYILNVANNIHMKYNANRFKNKIIKKSGNYETLSFINIHH